MALASLTMDQPTESFNWRTRANCRDMADLKEGNPFFVEGYGANYPLARVYCASCPVVVDCLVECLLVGLNEDDEGMWGCMSPNERRTTMKLIERGMGIKKAVESIWDRQRKRKNGSMVPSKDVWKEWRSA